MLGVFRKTRILSATKVSIFSKSNFTVLIERASLKVPHDQKGVFGLGGFGDMVCAEAIPIRLEGRKFVQKPY